MALDKMHDTGAFEGNDVYTADPTHVRIHSDGIAWFVDGADDEGRYTEACWSYDTHAEACADAENFVKAATRDYHYTWNWRNSREYVPNRADFMKRKGDLFYVGIDTDRLLRVVSEDRIIKTDRQPGEYMVSFCEKYGDPSVAEWGSGTTEDDAIRWALGAYFGPFDEE